MHTLPGHFVIAKEAKLTAATEDEHTEQKKPNSLSPGRGDIGLTHSASYGLDENKKSPSGATHLRFIHPNHLVSETGVTMGTF